MNLKDLAAKPQLTKLTIDDEDIVSQFGEPLDFYTWDRQPMDVFLNIARGGKEDMGAVIEVMKDLIMDEAGSPIMKDGMVLPGPVLIACVNKIVVALGK